MASWKVALDGVRAGTFTATVFHDAVGRARKRWALGARILAGKTISPHLVILFKLVTKENVSSFQMRPDF